MSTPPVEQDVDGNPSPEQILQSLADYINSDLVEVYPEECGPVPQTVTVEFWNCYVDFVNPFPFDDYEKSKEISEFANSFPSEIASESHQLCGTDFGQSYNSENYPNMDYWDCMVEQVERLTNTFFPPRLGYFGAPQGGYEFFVDFLEDSGVSIPDECAELGYFYLSSEYAECIVTSVLEKSDFTSPSGQNTTDIFPRDKTATLIFPDKIAESRSTSIAQMSTASISFISSIVIICMIQRSYTGLSSTFHRLLFGLSIADILSSFWLMLSTLMSPTYTSGYIWNPRGNVHSCDTQGFFLFLGIMGAPLYNCSLCFYYLAVVKFNKKDAFIRKKLEPFFHAVPILVSVTGAIIILAKESFNANGSYCWINERNSYCEIESVSCERGKDVKIIFSIFAVGPIIILPIVIVTTMVVMYREVIKIEKKLSKYGVGALRQNLGDNKKNDHQSDDANSASNKKSTIQRVRGWWTNLWPFNKSSARPSRSNNSRLQSRVILHKAILYSLAFLCTYIFPFVTSIQYWAEYQTSSTLKILASTCFPLQGFFNFLVFIHPKVTNTKRTKKLSWFQSFVTALKSRGDKNKNGGRSQLRSGGKKSKSKTSQNTTAVDAPRFRQKRKKMIFNRQPARRKKCRNRKFIADTQ